MKRITDRWSGLQIGIVVAILMLCCCASLLLVGFALWARTRPVAPATPTRVPLLSQPAPTHTPGAPHPTPSRATGVAPLFTPTPAWPGPTETPRVVLRTPDPSTARRLLSTELPQRDIRLLAERLTAKGPIPEVVRDTAPLYQLGDKAEFWVGNVDTMEQFRVTAVLRYETPHLYMWVEEGVPYDKDGLARSAENFERKVYPTNRAFFGSEWTPGVDSDPHLHVLHSTGEHMGATVAGYYASADEYSQLANPYSNEREMFYISLDGMMLPGTDLYDGVLAHEFQHMIHWANDRNEETWVNEGCSELAAYLNGYDPGGFEWLFLMEPDVQLTTWSELGDSAPHYGSSYLFMAYFLGRFGDDVLQRVIAHPENGAAGFDAVLAERGLTFDDVFADWLVANYLDNLAAPDAQERERYIYPDHEVGPVAVDITHDSYPVQRRSEVHQYAADYVEIKGAGDLQIAFAGDIEARLVPAEAHSGRYAWWSNRGDDSDATLTRAFDLRSVQEATLSVWMWYDIEQDWDYAYVEVSTDRGETWDILAGPSTTTRNPNGNSFGAAYTGESGGWIDERFDLSPHVGQEVLVRFEYVTDDAVNRSGWLIDDVRVPELGYEEDFEAGAGDWDSAGFVYSDNRVPQRYLVQLVSIGRQVEVTRVALDAQQRGAVELRELGTRVDSAVLVISAVAPVTTEVARYEYRIERR